MRLILLLSLVVVLTVTAILLPIEISYLWRWGSELAGYPMAMVGIILVMAVLMSVGLPGSLCFWLIAPFNAPLFSVGMLLAGSVAGAMGAYRFGKGLGDTWSPGYFARQVLNLLGKRSDFLTQCAVRILPGFPHAYVNFAGGVLGLPLLVFCCAAIVGLGIKWTVYANAVHGMVSAGQAEEAMDLFVLLPLIILALLLALGGLAKRWFLGQSKVDCLPPG